jgi:hypothetical protein
MPAYLASSCLVLHVYMMHNCAVRGQAGLLLCPVLCALTRVPCSHPCTVCCVVCVCVCAVLCVALSLMCRAVTCVACHMLVCCFYNSHISKGSHPPFSDHTVCAASSCSPHLCSICVPHVSVGAHAPHTRAHTHTHTYTHTSS